MTTNKNLIALEAAKLTYGPGWGTRKAALLARLARTRLGSPAEVERLHEVALFMRAYPDDRRVLAAAERLLRRFADRADLRTHRGALADTGIRGTLIHYPFFWPTARWLARRVPQSLRLDRDDAEAAEGIAQVLPLMVSPAEAAWLAEREPSGFTALDRLRGAATDAAFLLGRIDAMPGDSFTREALHDRVNASYVLAPGRNTPQRTLERYRNAPIVFRKSPPERTRPELAQTLRRAPERIRTLDARAGATLVDLARGAMVCRARDLDAFAYASADDVVLVDDGDGLAFAFNGVTPDRRNLFPGIYGCLTIRNGVPLGYIQMDVLGRWGAVSFNTFPTYRGADAAHVFGRMLAATHHLFGTTSFSVEPYQLGHNNYEGLESGAWWFYYKLGFRPTAPAARRVVRAELARMRTDPEHRSSRRALLALARSHVFWHADRANAVGLPHLAALGEATARAAARGIGADGLRLDPLDPGARAWLAWFGLRSLAGFNAAERAAWQRWSPLLHALPGAARWTPRERAALVSLVRAKAARREIGFLRAFNAHPRLEAAFFR